MVSHYTVDWTNGTRRHFIMGPSDKFLEPGESEIDEEILNYPIVAPRATVSHGEINSNVEFDYRYARQNIRQIIETSVNLLTPLSKMAAEQQSARTMEVLSNHLKLMLDCNQALSQLHGDTKKILTENNDTSGGLIGVGEEQSEGSTIAFKGTTSELLEHLEQLAKIEKTKALETLVNPKS